MKTPLVVVRKTRKLDYVGRISIKTKKLENHWLNHFITRNAGAFPSSPRASRHIFEVRIFAGASLDDVLLLGRVELADTSTLKRTSGLVLYHDDPDNITR